MRFNELTSNKVHSLLAKQLIAVIAISSPAQRFDIPETVTFQC